MFTRHVSSVHKRFVLSTVALRLVVVNDPWENENVIMNYMPS